MTQPSPWISASLSSFPRSSLSASHHHHHPPPNPMAPSPPTTPTTRPPSRSERLLRDTLRRDELASPARVHHPRRHSNPSTKAPADHPSTSTSHPSPPLHRSTTAPRRPHRPHTASSAHGVADRDSRPSSPSPSSRREPHDPAHPPPALTLTLTPHEQVLRARLERVLQAGRGIARAESRDRDPRRDRDRFERRTSIQSTTVSTASSGPCDDSCDELWFFREHPNPLSASPTFSFQAHPQDAAHHCLRSSTDPTPFTPPSPTSSSRSHSHSRHSPSNMHSPRLLRHVHPHQLPVVPTEYSSDEPLTPPPTPPLLTSPLSHPPKPPRLVPSAAHPSVSPQTPFNARTASAHCRQIEGYVSFASVEGLGQPPAGCDDEDPGTAAEERKGRVILGRIWRALSGEAVGSR